MNSKKVKFFKITIGIVVLILIIGIVAYMLPVLKELNTPEGQINFKNRVDDSGFLGLLWLFGIQVAQIFLIFIPGEPIEILAGMCYGTFWGTVFIMISAFIISTAIFFMVRKFGRRFVYNFCDKRKISHIENLKIFKDPRKVERVLFILFLLPGTPKDLLSYIAGLLPVKPSRYLIVCNLARFPSVISSTIAGKNLAVGNIKASVFLYIVTIILTVLLILVMNIFDKSKVTEEALNSIKNKDL